MTPKSPQKKTSQPPESPGLDYAAWRALALQPWLVHLHGNRFASVLAIKGQPGEAENKGQPPFFGSDGEALESAFVALGWGSNNWCGIALDLPGKGVVSEQDLRMLIEIIDPTVLLALDRMAALKLKESYGELLPSIPEPGIMTKLLGRALVFVDGFEAALTSQQEDEAKRRAWQQLKAIKTSPLLSHQ
ncbi:MAG: hypothetical protein LBP91_01330 [Coriobacteriales bacterium]|jgi:hypothetical protein|nr:hypothetical protein [Coriobacteriales bacterium]